LVFGDVVVSPPTARLALNKGYAPQVEIYIPMSPEGVAVKQVVREPIQSRHPVGYNNSICRGRNRGADAVMSKPTFTLGYIMGYIIGYIRYPYI